MMLRTIALSDQKWFATAGTRRGGITNASSTGYINAEGEFVPNKALNEGQRDTCIQTMQSYYVYYRCRFSQLRTKTRFAGTSS